MKNTITVVRQLAEQVSAKEGVNVFDCRYPANRRVINQNNVASRTDVRNGSIFYCYGIATPNAFYVFRNRAEQCDWLRDRL